jgi:hypothetical protein
MTDEPSQTIVDAVILEDYRLWLQELQKQDRWFAEVVWLVLAGTAAGMTAVLQTKPFDTAAGLVLVSFIGLVFVSINADFLATRIVSYRHIARRVAAVRAALGVDARLRFAAELLEQGSPLLASNPAAFCRTAHTGQHRGSGFRPLFLAHAIALATIYIVLGFGLADRLSNAEPITASALYLMAAIGSFHSLVFSAVFRWRISEATSLGQFLVTLARDQGVRVSPNAEQLIDQWLSERPPSARLHTNRAVRAIIRFEDRRFFTPLHPGIDIISIAAVLVRRRRRGGATTIPMQLSRQLLRTLESAPIWPMLKRKLFESAIGIYLVMRKGRSYVLNKWLATARFGRPDIIGIEAAARRYFDKHVDQLDEIDGLLLAERLTVCTGRYYQQRISRLASWAAHQALIAADSRPDVARRFHEMVDRVPGDVREDLPGS